MNILVIDGMGGGLGKAVIEHLKNASAPHAITAVGTNALATAAMLKAGADCGATGENAIAFNCANTDVIIGAIGIVFANAMHGEISPKIAEAVSSSTAHKILIPVDKCNATILGLREGPIQAHINEIGAALKKISEKDGKA